METGFLRDRDGLLPGQKRRTVSFSALLGVFLSSDLLAFESHTIRGFACTGVAFLFLSRLLKIQNILKATLQLLLVGCEQALLRARDRAGRVFRTCGVGVGGAFVRVAFVCGPQLVGLQRT